MNAFGPFLRERRFRDRHDAGRQLAAKLAAYAGEPGLLVLALPRGGVPVGWEVARALEAELDVIAVHKLGVPGHEELAMGAVTADGVRVLNESLVRALRFDAASIEAAAAREERRLRERERIWRGDRPPPEVKGRPVIVVDDGLATGATMRAALRSVRRREPARLIAGAPVGAPDTCAELADEADEVVCVIMPPALDGVSLWYDDFSQTTDDEVRALLQRPTSADA